jgi:hypothetical protein
VPALLGVIGGELPVFFGRLNALQESFFLFFVGDMQKELANDNAVACQVALEAADVLKTFLPDVFRYQLGRQFLFF